MNAKIIEKMMAKAFRKIPACEQIVVATADGIGIACYPQNCDFADSIAASSTSITGLSDASSEFLGKGEVNYTLIRSTCGFILVFGMGTYNLFIMSGRKVNLGMLLLVGNKLADDLAQVVSEMVVKRELEEDIHMLARELAEAQSDDKVQIELMLEDEIGEAGPKDLKETISLAEKIANECAKQDIPCDIRISIEEPIKPPSTHDHTDYEPTTERIEAKETINPEDVKPGQVAYHNEISIYHQEPHKDRPEPTKSPITEHGDETVLEPTTLAGKAVRFIPDEIPPKEVRFINDSEVSHETVEFKEKAMQDYGVTHDNHVVEPSTEKLPDVPKPEVVKPIEVRHANDSEHADETVEFEPKQMQDYGKEHDDQTLEPATEHIPTKEKVNPEDVKPEFVIRQNEVPIYHEEPKIDSSDPTVIPKTEADETVLEPTTFTKRYEGTRVLPDEVATAEIRRMNDSEISHEKTEFEPKAMQDYGVTHDNHVLEPSTEKLPDVPKPEVVKPIEVRHANDSEHADETVEFEPKQMQDYGKEHDDQTLEPATEHIPTKEKVNPEDVKPEFVIRHNEVPIYHEEPKIDSSDPTVIPKTEADETVLEPTTDFIRYNGTRILSDEVKPKDVTLANDSVEHHEPVVFELKEMKEYGVIHEDHAYEPTTEKIDANQIDPDSVKPTQILRMSEADHEKAHDYPSKGQEADDPDTKKIPLDPSVTSVLDRLNKAIDSFKTNEKSLFDKEEVDPFSDKDDLTEY